MCTYKIEGLTNLMAPRKRVWRTLHSLQGRTLTSPRFSALCKKTKIADFSEFVPWDKFCVTNRRPWMQLRTGLLGPRPSTAGHWAVVETWATRLPLEKSSKISIGRRWRAHQIYLQVVDWGPEELVLIVVDRSPGRIRTLLRLGHGACRLGHGDQLSDTAMSALTLNEILCVLLIRFVSSAWSSRSPSPSVLLNVKRGVDENRIRWPISSRFAWRACAEPVTF